MRTQTFVSQKEEIVINFLTQHTLSGKSEEIYWCEFYFSINYMQEEMLNHLKFDVRLSHTIILPQHKAMISLFRLRLFTFLSLKTTLFGFLA
jgi:hypothetical protein